MTGHRHGSAQEVVAAVVDPEIRVITIAELGILREVRTAPGGAVRVTITPTYAGCPAMDLIRADIRTALAGAGYPEVTVETVLSPAWSTDWISPTGRDKLAAAGIAPPAPTRSAAGPVPISLAVRCPRCGSLNTEELARFAATACKALWRCRACREPFEKIKTL